MAAFGERRLVDAVAFGAAASSGMKSSERATAAAVRKPVRKESGFRGAAGVDRNLRAAFKVGVVVLLPLAAADLDVPCIIFTLKFNS